MEIIKTDKAAQPLGHYSQAVKSNGFIFVSGQLPALPEGGFETGDIKDQTRLALQGLKDIVEAAGSTLEKVVKVTIFISDIALWAEANDAYAEFFGAHKPARSAVPVKDLPRGVSIEIEAIAEA
jgi:2-iminobutanoate/2-iminopropanoate deaminase